MIRIGDEFAANLTSYREYAKIPDRPVGLFRQGHSSWTWCLGLVNPENGYEFAHLSQHFCAHHGQGLRAWSITGRNRGFFCCLQEPILDGRVVPFNIEKDRPCDEA